MRTLFSLLHILVNAATSMFVAFRRQKLGPLILIGALLLVLAVIFGFLAFTPILSPFIYPLF